MAHRPDPWTAASLLAAALIAAFLVLGPALAWRPPSFHLVVGARQAAQAGTAAMIDTAGGVLRAAL